jgi:digeranylgeranylglycerophospholipid reductase
VLLGEDRAHDQDSSAKRDHRLLSLERTDVLVVGLGPAGSSAAAAAARLGARVLAVDRRHEAGRPVQCAEFVPAMIGIEIDELSASVRQSIGSMITFVGDDPPDVTRPFPGQMLDRAAFDAALVERAMGAGACCRFDVRVRALHADGRIELDGGSEIAARVIVGADGPRSVVGRAIGQINTELVETRQITVALEQAHDATDIFLSPSIPGGYGWLFPKGSAANLGAGVEPKHKKRLKAIVDGLHAMLIERGRVGAQVLERTGGAIPVGGMLVPHGTLGKVQVLLAGDAAGLAHPVTGAGIAAAVYSGRLAGEAARAILAGDAAAAHDYEDELRAVFGASLARALERRRALRAAAEQGARGTPNGAAVRAALRRSWIAYPEYWAA